MLATQSANQHQRGHVQGCWACSALQAYLHRPLPPNSFGVNVQVQLLLLGSMLLSAGCQCSPHLLIDLLLLCSCLPVLRGGLRLPTALAAVMVTPLLVPARFLAASLFPVEQSRNTGGGLA
jgi:hypothetical protein